MSAGSGASGGPDDGGDADDAPADATEREATAPTAGADVAAPSTSKQRRSKKHKRKKHKAKAGSRSGATDEASVEIGPLPDWEEVVTPDGVRYFYNHATGVSQFEEPADEAFQPATKLTKEFRSADGRIVEQPNGLGEASGTSGGGSGGAVAFTVDASVRAESTMEAHAGDGAAAATVAATAAAGAAAADGATGGKRKASDSSAASASFAHTTAAFEFAMGTEATAPDVPTARRDSGSGARAAVAAASSSHRQADADGSSSDGDRGSRRRSSRSHDASQQRRPSRRSSGRSRRRRESAGSHGRTRSPGAASVDSATRAAAAAGKASVSRDGNSDYGDGGSKVEGEGDETSLLDDIEVDVGGSVQRSRTSSDKVVKLFFIQSMCHAFICEAPMVVVEVVIRVPLDLLAAFVVALGACVARNAAWGQRASGFALDALLLLLIGVTAVVPGGILTAYRNFSAEDDTWDLTPIVTLLGNADPRRSIVIRHGQGEWAANADPPGRDELGRRVYDMDMLCGVPLAPPPVEIGVANDSDLEYGLSSGDDDGRGSDAGRSQELHTAA